MTLRLIPAALGGRALALAARVVATLRPAAKPLHPEGSVLRGALLRRGGGPRTGVPLLDEPGRDDVLVRLSRAVGLPGRLPDVHGLALRIGPESAHPVDILFATTGLGPLTRFTLTLARRASSRPMTTLLPYRTGTGPLLLAAEAMDDTRWGLSWARPRGGWHQFADLELGPGSSDAPISFDPVLRPATGLENYDWVRVLREPAYATARSTKKKQEGMIKVVFCP